MLADNHSNGLALEPMPRKADSMLLTAMEKGDDLLPKTCPGQIHAGRTCAGWGRGRKLGNQKMTATVLAGDPEGLTRTVTEGTEWREIAQRFLREHQLRGEKDEGEMGKKKKRTMTFNASVWGFPSPSSPWSFIFQDKWLGRKKQGYNLSTILPRRMSLSDTIVFLFFFFWHHSFKRRKEKTDKEVRCG